MNQEIVPYRLPGEIEQAVVHLAARSDVLMFGETHGTQEVPRLVAGLLEGLTALGYQAMAIEMPHHWREELVDWAEGKAADPPPFFMPPWSQDGRGNLQVLSLVRQVLDHGWQVLCFDQGYDQPGEQWTDRDSWMAHNLVAQWQQYCRAGKIIGICGNLHSRLISPTSESYKFWPTCAHYTQQRHQSARVNSIAVVFHSGEFFNMGRHEFTPKSPPLTMAAELRWSGSLGHSAELHLPQATAATFLVPPSTPKSTTSDE